MTSLFTLFHTSHFDRFRKGITFILSADASDLRLPVDYATHPDLARIQLSSERTGAIRHFIRHQVVRDADHDVSFVIYRNHTNLRLINTEVRIHND